jgi:A/G-specific adenine glycosylase
LVHPQRVRRFRERILLWADQHGRSFPWRSPDASTYHRVISEVLLQRTRAEVVSNMFGSFIQLYPSWRSLSAAKQRDLQATLRPLGLWRRRAISMSAFAKEMANRRGRFPKTRQSLEQIPAVGQYVANAILLFSHGRAEPLIDANMARVIERYFGPRKLADIRFDPYLQDIARQLVRGPNPAKVNWAVLDFAALVCLPGVPRCDICFVKEGCRAFRALGSPVAIARFKRPSGRRPSP